MSLFRSLGGYSGGSTEGMSNEPHSLDAPQRGAGGFGVGSSLCFLKGARKTKQGGLLAHVVTSSHTLR